MRGMIAAMLLTVAILAAPVGAQQTPPGPTDENLMLTMPRGFKLVVSGGQPQVTGLAQYVPENETKEDWTLEPDVF